MVTQRRGEETRSRILDTAQECFTLQGYDATGVAEICRRAGLSKGAFYHHFPSKQDLFLDLLDRWLAGLDEQLEAAREEAATAPEGLLRMADMAQQVFQEAGGQLPIFLEFWAQAAHDPAVWQATIAPYRRYRALFSKMIEAGIAEGSLRSTNPQTAAQILVALAVGLLLQASLDPHGADWGQAAEESIRMMLASWRR